MVMIPSGFGQVNWRMEGIGLDGGAEVTCGFELDGITPTALGVAALLHDAWDDHIVTNLSNLQVHVSTMVKLGPTATGPSAVVAGSQAGSDSSAPLPGGNAYLVVKTTDFGGRAGRGRMFVPGLTEAGTGPGNFINETKLAEIVSDWNDMYAEMVGANLNPVVLHGENSPLSTPTAITSFDPQNRVATQRRRTRR
uniref:Uncharacterized protein n=1 Tax=uncultured prokaryote TaxID=198431 RepID=A0A0H5Q4A3_9ZZZZ|nr:hypothetical protein [uncultured prokaryote]